MKDTPAESLTSASVLHRKLAGVPLGRLVAVAMFFVLASNAHSLTWGAWSYYLTDDIPQNAIITGGPTSGSITIPASCDGHTVIGIGFGAFQSCSGLTSVTLPSCVREIGQVAFNGCTRLTSMTIPSSVTTIGPGAFGYCQSLPSFSVASGNYSFTSIDGVLYTKDKKTLVCVPAGKSGSLTLPGTVRTIESDAFWGCGKLTALTIPEGVTDIGMYAFCGMNGLKTLKLPNSLKIIGGDAFVSCNSDIYDKSSVPGVFIVDGWVVGHDDALSGNLALSGIRGIGCWVFSGCDGLSSVTLPNSLRFVGVQAFARCTGLSSITIPENTEYLGKLAFENCTSLTDVRILGNVTNDWEVEYWSWGPYGPFKGCSKLKTVFLGDKMTKIGNYMFHDLPSLESIKIPDSITRIGSDAFRNCTSLSNVTLGNGLKEIDGYAFEGCAGLTALSIPDSVTNLAYGVFYGCNNLTTISAPAAWVDTAMLDAGKVWGGHYWNEGGKYPDGLTIVYRGYTMVFDANGGRGTMAEQLIPCFAEKRLNGNAFTKDGCVFLGWSTTKTGEIIYGDRATVQGLGKEGDRIILFAKWANATYKIAFDANGGTLPKGKTMPAQKMAYGKAAALQANAFTRKGYVFYGWSRSNTGKREFANKAEVKNLRTDGKTQTLYAVWAKQNYTVAFDANGGKGKMSAQKMTFGKAANLAKNAFTRKGWLFLGWATSKANADKGTVAYKNAASVKNLRTDGKTTTLYAVWEKAQTVKFNPNGGTCAVAEKDFKVGNAYGAFPTPERKWHTFLGWFSAATGGEWVAETDVAETSATRTLFAHWEYIPLVLGETTKAVGPDAAAKLSVSVSAKAAWTAAADTDWISVRTKSGTSGSGSLVFDVAKNAGKARTGRIIVSADGKAVVLTVSQKARTLTLSASNKVFKAAAAKGQKLGVTATVAWTAKSSAKWLKVKTAKGKGNGTVVYELAGNKGAGRAATITVSGGGKTATFRVEQKGPDGSEPVAEIPSPTHYLTIDPTWQTFAAGKATNEMAFVESDLSWTATTKESWIVLDSNAKAGSGDGILRYSVEANTGLARTGTVSVAASGLKATLTIEQAAKETPLYLYVMPTTRTATAAAAAKESIWVEANVAWTAGSGDDWIDVKTLSGTGSGGLSYSMAANTATTNRTGTITLFGGGLSAEFTLTQEGRKAGSTAPEEPDPPVAKYLRVNPTAREHGDAAQTGSFLVEANIPWTVTVSANWIVLHTRSGANNGAVSYSLAKNTGDTRTGFITVSGNGVPPATFTVVQKGKGGGVDPIPGPTPGPTPTPTPTPTPVSKWIKINGATQANVVVPAEGGQTAVYVTTKPLDMQWGVRTSQPSWIHLETVGGIGSGAVSFHVDPNPSKSKRSGTITVWSGSKSARCKVVQEGKVPYLKVSPTQFADIPWKGQNGLSVLVRSNVDWSVSASPGIRLHTSGGTGDGTITFDVSKNPDYKERTLTMTVSGVDVKPITVVIIQEKATLLKVSPTSRSFSHEKAGGSLSVTANVKWQATSSASWITLTRASGNGNGIITFTVSKNTTGKKRVGTITVTGGGKTVTVTITQNAAPYLKVSPTSKTVPFNAASYQLSVTANVSWKAKSGATWISLTTASGKGDGTIVFKVSKNTTGKKRVGTITVTGGGLSRKATITQKKEPKLSISPTKMTIDSDAVYSWFYVTSDVDWTAKTDSDWVKLRTASGKGNGIKNGGYVDFDAEENNGAKTRTAKITVTGGGKSVAFTLTQKGRPNLCFYRPDGWPAAAYVTALWSGTDTDSTTPQTSFYANQKPIPYIRCAVANVGGTKAGSFKVGFVGLRDTGSKTSGTRTISGLPSMTWDDTGIPYKLSENGYSYFLPPPAGTYSVTITLDSGNVVKESNENDNTATVYFTVVDANQSAYSGRAALSYATLPPDKNVEVEPEPPIVEQNPEEPVDNEMPDKAGWVAVVASGGEDAGAVADGDEETAWTPDVTEESWVVLTFPEPVDATDAELVGDNLPDGTRLFFSEDSETWHEELPASVQYVWAVFPACEDPFAVREIRLISE